MLFWWWRDPVWVDLGNIKPYAAPESELLDYCSYGLFSLLFSASPLTAIFPVLKKVRKRWWFLCVSVSKFLKKSYKMVAQGSPFCVKISVFPWLFSTETETELKKARKYTETEFRTPLFPMRKYTVTFQKPGLFLQKKTVFSAFLLCLHLQNF